MLHNVSLLFTTFHYTFYIEKYFDIATNFYRFKTRAVIVLYSNNIIEKTKKNIPKLVALYIDLTIYILQK
jgi:hypothetical protein